MDPSENSFFPIQHYILKFTFVDAFVTTAWYPALRVEFSRQEYCSKLSFPSLGDLPDPGIESGSPALQANTVSFLYLLKNFFFSLFIYFPLKDNCFKIFCWFLSYINMNQPQVYICPSLLNLFPTSHSIPPL